MPDPLDVAAIRALIVNQIAIADGMKYSDARAVANRTAAALTALLVRVEALEGAIRWALGEQGEFTIPAEPFGRYWWRKELRRRAALQQAAARLTP